ncbi:MAG: Protein translocase subunit SecY [Candidatus Magasanikbacteria bacterium GW2011_GWC2_40_17]|uniref:Protein translocase subunit SecY n=1 Tax=Candidatus Magasanikbacteria bacterium GW2011_GWA2_42_32 TaxID=1619039 RepID=A0A0G1A6Y6_9BACT|nr:MAG: Protein translocase subunit SecY [Candidatus Magasanikbacteria bacterium GW2011_GWC2_40_17]KKS56785.1 MAG: Protein translocase subunit SecY [Candidatus Magasanikbacteria bacterium GW2011_GWA2_42_32]OGH86028.1 MAG: preprotein translocase subunit SecY [Candidatus Magasanikbacteria bacterium RIFOXYB2_FULL_38_10]
MLEKLLQIWKTKDLRNKILYVVLMLVIFRLVAYIPIPGVDIIALRRFFDSNQLLGLMNVFSGGTMQNFSVIMLGVGPYITASIIFQLLAMVVPSLEEMSKEGEAGQRRLNQYTRLLTVPLAFLQAYSMIMLLRQTGQGIVGNLDLFHFITTMVTITGGTMFLMWLGELISEKGIGNGISILIFAGIISSLPTSLQQMFVTFDRAQIIELIIYALIAIVTIVGVVFVTEAQRNIPVVYAKQVRGNRVFGGGNNHLPLRVNMAGVIPIIFAISIILFPSMVAQFFIKAKTAWLASLAQGTIHLFNNSVFYAAAYFLLVVGFTYFYTAVIFHPQKIAENLQKQGGFIPGVRPGKLTTEYLQYTMNRILLAGSVFLGVIAILPLILRNVTGSQSMVIGGTSLLIVVAVVIEIVKQVESQMTMRDYEQY